MKRPLSLYSATLYIRHFDSWYKALELLERKIAGRESKTCEEKIFVQNSEKPVKKIKNISVGLRFAVFKRDKFKCRICGKSPATHPNITLHVDHIIPRSMGGETTIGNLQTLCSECNLGKGTKLITLPEPKQEQKPRKSIMYFIISFFKKLVIYLISIPLKDKRIWNCFASARNLNH